MTQYLLCDEGVGLVIVIAVALLTLMEAIWQYVARVSFVLPMVRKNKESRLKTSASVVSNRLLYVVLSSRTSLSFVTEMNVGPVGGR